MPGELRSPLPAESRLQPGLAAPQSLLAEWAARWRARWRGHAGGALLLPGLRRAHIARRGFQLDGPGAMPVLLDHHQMPVGRDGDDVHPVDAINHIDVMLLPGAGGDDPVGAEGEDAEIADVLGADFLPGLDVHG